MGTSLYNLRESQNNTISSDRKYSKTTDGKYKPESTTLLPPKLIRRRVLLLVVSLEIKVSRFILPYI